MKIKNIKILLVKELEDTFKSPLIYGICALFLFMMGWLFFNYLIQAKDLSSGNVNQAVLIPIFGNINFIFIFMAPLITMKSIAEEQKNKTLNLLLRSNLSEWEIAIGKYLGLVTQASFLLIFTLIFPIVLIFSGYSDYGIIFTSYLGIFFSVLAYMSVGLFFSSITENQIVSGLLTFCWLLGSMLLVISTNAFNNFLLSSLIQYFTIPFHYESFVKGVIKSYSIVYFLSYILFMLTLTQVSLKSRKW